MALNAEQLKNMLDKGFVLYSKNGIIKYIEIPEHGNIKLKVQNRQIVYKEVTNGEQC